MQCMLPILQLPRCNSHSCSDEWWGRLVVVLSLLAVLRSSDLQCCIDTVHHHLQDSTEAQMPFELRLPRTVTCA